MSKKNKKDQYSLSDIFREMELELIESMKRNLSKHEAWERELGFQWEQWQSAKLRSLSQYQIRNRKIIKSYQNDIRDTIDEVLHASYDDAYRKSLELTKSWDLETTFDSSSPFGADELLEDNFFHTNDDKLDVIIEEMQKTFINSEGLTMRKMDDTYRQVLDKAVLKMGAGTTTIQKAIDDSTKEFLSKGIDCITYKNGRKVNIASYAEMYLRTANQQATFLAQGKVRDKLGIYTVLMSQHENCSTMCLPYQGTVMTDDVYTSISKDDAIQLARETGYTRLSTAIENHAFHPNCRHSISTWYPGKSATPKPFTDEQNAKAVDRYKREQEQRLLENNIRKWKRIEAGSVDTENKKIAQDMVKKYRSKLRNHIKSNPNLRRKYWRERMEPMLDLRQEELVNKSILQSPYEDVTQQWLDDIDPSRIGEVGRREYFERDTTRYDAKNSKLKYNFDEGEEYFAKSIIVDKLHEDVDFVPRVKPHFKNGDYIPTPDFYFKNEYWELKSIEGHGKNTILDAVKRASEQSGNVFIHITEKSDLTEEMINSQLESLFKFNRYEFVEKITVVKDNKIYRSMQKKR